MQFFFHVSDDATDACERVYISIFRTNVNIWKLDIRNIHFYIEELFLATEAQYIMGL